MALAMRGFIPGAPKPSTLQVPSCKSDQQNAMTILQKQHHGLKYSRKISHSLITCRITKTTTIGKGGGSKINGTTPSQQVNSNLSSTNSERTGNQSKGEANATPHKTGEANSGAMK